MAYKVVSMGGYWGVVCEASSKVHASRLRSYATARKMAERLALKSIKTEQPCG